MLTKDFLQRRSTMNNETNATANREYKSTVFAQLFKDKKKLLSLYNALNNSNYMDDNDLEIVTLENAIYMTMKNDLAFLLDCLFNRCLSYLFQYP